MLSPEILEKIKEISGCPNNFPEFELEKIRAEVQRITFMRNIAVNLSPQIVMQLDNLIELNKQMLQLGSQPLCHADLLQMWQVLMNIRISWTMLNMPS